MIGFGSCAICRLRLMETSSEKDPLPDKTYCKEGNQQSNTTLGPEKHKIIGRISRRQSTLTAEVSPRSPGSNSRTWEGHSAPEKAKWLITGHTKNKLEEFQEIHQLLGGTAWYYVFLLPVLGFLFCIRYRSFHHMCYKSIQRTSPFYLWQLYE